MKLLTEKTHVPLYTVFDQSILSTSVMLLMLGHIVVTIP